MEEKKPLKAIFLDYVMITIAALLLDIGVYLFKFPNNFENANIFECRNIF